jgi:uncharacterized membrane protein YccC
MVIFMTPYILILFHFLGLGILDVAGERLLDTAIGSTIAFLGSYFLFPYWEAKHMPGYMAEVLKANLDYLVKLGEWMCGKNPSSMEYKLVRKNVFVTTANMAAAFQRMQSEPKDKQIHPGETHEFVVLNHVLSSNIAAVSAYAGEKETGFTKENFQILKKSISILDSTLSMIEPEHQNIELDFKMSRQGTSHSENTSVSGQLRFIQKVAGDIKRITSKISERRPS